MRDCRENGCVSGVQDGTESDTHSLQRFLCPFFSVRTGGSDVAQVCIVVPLQEPDPIKNSSHCCLFVLGFRRPQRQQGEEGSRSYDKRGLGTALRSPRRGEQGERERQLCTPPTDDDGAADTREGRDHVERELEREGNGNSLLRIASNEWDVGRKEEEGW